MKSLKVQIPVVHINTLQIELFTIISGAILVAMAMATILVMVVSAF